MGETIGSCACLYEKFCLAPHDLSDQCIAGNHHGLVRLQGTGQKCFLLKESFEALGNMQTPSHQHPKMILNLSVVRLCEKLKRHGCVKGLEEEQKMKASSLGPTILPSVAPLEHPTFEN